MDFAASLAAVEGRIAVACSLSGRSRDEVLLVAVSKEQPDEGVRALHALGVRDFGENKVQALAARMTRLADLADVRWHLIGPLQTNKAKDVAALAGRGLALVQTVDRWGLVEALAKRLSRDAGAPLDVLVQVDIDREPQKAGVEVAELPALLDALARTPSLRMRGLMAIPRALDAVGPEAAAHAFEAMRGLFDAHRARFASPPILSMGMSDDFELAIAHGATMVRVGSALFGPRPMH